jgi:hypothetical protein
MLVSAFVLAFAAAASKPVVIEPPAFKAYKSACLDTQADPAAVRALAGAKGWSALTAEEKDAIQPGNPDAVEGWGIGSGTNRMRVSISSGALKGLDAGSSQTTCTLTAAQSDDDGMIKAYSQQLKRNPGDTSNDGGVRTAVWSVMAGGGRAMHYYFGGANGAERTSTLSVTVLRKTN